MLLLTGCYPALPPLVHGEAQPRSLRALVPLRDPRVLRICPPRTPLHLGGVVAPTDRVLICRGGLGFLSDGATTYGPWEVADTIPRPERLLAAYRVANAPLQTTGCPRDPQDPLLIWIDRGGILTSYAAPVDGCGAPQARAAAAYGGATRFPILEIDTGAPGYHRDKG